MSELIQQMSSRSKTRSQKAQVAWAMVVYSWRDPWHNCGAHHHLLPHFLLDTQLSKRSILGDRLRAKQVLVQFPKNTGVFTNQQVSKNHETYSQSSGKSPPCPQALYKYLTWKFHSQAGRKLICRLDHPGPGVTSASSTKQSDEGLR